MSIFSYDTDNEAVRTISTRGSERQSVPVRRLAIYSVYYKSREVLLSNLGNLQRSPGLPQTRDFQKYYGGDNFQQARRRQDETITLSDLKRRMTTG